MVVKFGKVFAALLFFAGCCWHVLAQSCNVCQSNGVACINTTSFNLCFGGSVPDTAQTFHCIDGLVCTDRPNICFQNNAATASCGDTSSCGRCNSNLVFSCTSRQTFSFCFGATLHTSVSGRCPTGMTCDASTQAICVSQLQPTSIVCHLDTPSATKEVIAAETIYDDDANTDYYK